jgi:uncharacterized protein (DUF58 family)
MEFDEVRHYEPGDDVRSIDWNVSARFGTPYVKMYREEREFTICLVLDRSASMYTGGTANPSGTGFINRSDQAVLAAALVAFSAERAGQRVGAVFFDQDITQVLRPRRGRSHIMALISGALQENNGRPGKTGEKGSSLGAALAGTGRLLKRRSLVVILSDFLCVNWEQELGDLCGKHDVIAIGIGDPMDMDLPDLGLISMEDPETGLNLHIPAGFPSLRSAWSEWHGDRAALWTAICRRCGAACLELSTAEDAPAALTRFFGGRGKPRREYRRGGL